MGGIPGSRRVQRPVGREDHEQQAVCERGDVAGHDEAGDEGEDERADQDGGGGHAGAPSNSAFTWAAILMTSHNGTPMAALTCATRLAGILPARRQSIIVVLATPSFVPSCGTPPAISIRV